MFAVEEEWNDEEEAKALTQAVIGGSKQPDSTNVKFGKRSSLIRTLQALGSVPDWSKDAPQVGSDSETENVPAVHTKRKKKRSKKGRRGAATGGKAEDAVDDPVELGGEEEQPPTAAKKPKKKPKKPLGKVKDTQSKKAEGKEDSEAVMEDGKNGGNTLSRKQWRNKMKNKRKCKNKFVENGNPTQKVKKTDSAVQQDPEEVVSDWNSNRQVVQSQPQTKKNTLQKEVGSKAQKRKKVQEDQESSTSIADTETVQNKKFTKVQKTGGSQVQTGSLKGSGKMLLPKPEVERPQEEMREEQVPESSERRKRETKEQARKMERLRRRLLGSDKKESPAEQQQEEEGTPTNDEVKEVPEDRSAALRSRMVQRLEAARFRYINEVLYTTSSGEAKRMFKQDPQAFGIYHRGFTAQVQHWPSNPVDAIIAYIRHKPASLVVADFGCGDCKIAQSVKNKVHSFDLAPTCKLVTVCDMAHVPLNDATVDIAVFCLSLMGTNLGDFLMEANRVLVMGGVLKIAEVASRFENVRSFMSALSALGFKMVTKDEENSHFFSFEFVKTANAPDHVKAELVLRPCVYKKR